MKTLMKLYSGLIKLSDMTLSHLLDLAIRLYMAKIFWDSGLIKYQSYVDEDWESTVFLFEEVHPIPGVDPGLAAIGGTIGELVLPVLLAFGLFTRFGAAGLFVMTIVIQFIVPADYGIANNEHYFWMLLLAVPMLKGGGLLSIDGLFQKFVCKKCNKGENVCPMSTGEAHTSSEDEDAITEDDKETEQPA